MVLRCLTFVALLVLPAVAYAESAAPTGDDLQQGYQSLINDLARVNVSLQAQVLADKREIEKLKADKTKPDEKHGP